MTGELPTGTVTFLFTDIERSTDLIRELGPRFAAVRAEHRRLLREAFDQHGGREIDTAGDGFFVVFRTARDAVGAAASAQRVLSEWAREEDVSLRVRMGLHTAEPFLDDHGYAGVGVHRAARICAVGHGGQILLSNATAGVVEDLGLEGVEVRELGEHRLKDMNRPQPLFQLDVAGLESEFPPPASLDAAAMGRVATIVAVDLVGWSELMIALGDDEAGAAAARYHLLARSEVSPRGGRVAEAVADSVLAVFEQPRDALEAAVALRAALRREPWVANEHRCPARCAIHSGRLPRIVGTLGSAAAHAIRLCATAEPSQILLSHTTVALLEGEVPEVRLRDLGERTVARRDHPERVFAVAD